MRFSFVTKPSTATLRRCGSPSTSCVQSAAEAGRLFERRCRSIRPRSSARRARSIRQSRHRVAFDGLSARFAIDSRFALEVARPRRHGPQRFRSTLADRADGPNAVYCMSGGSITQCARSRRNRVGMRRRRAGVPRSPQPNAVRSHPPRHPSEGAARPAAATLALGHGACRDVTDLFLAACRSLGAPARFVSAIRRKRIRRTGATFTLGGAFAPGLGWLAYDPTHGVKVSTAMSACCAAPDQAATMPVEGGSTRRVTSTLDYQVEIETDAA